MHNDAGPKTFSFSCKIRLYSLSSSSSFVEDHKDLPHLHPPFIWPTKCPFLPPFLLFPYLLLLPSFPFPLHCKAAQAACCNKRKEEGTQPLAAMGDTEGVKRKGSCNSFLFFLSFHVFYWY